MEALMYKENWFECECGSSFYSQLLGLLATKYTKIPKEVHVTCPRCRRRITAVYPVERAKDYLVSVDSRGITVKRRYQKPQAPRSRTGKKV